MLRCVTAECSELFKKEDKHMAKNTITTPIKDQVMADNSTLSSNEIKKRIDTAAASVLPEVSGSDEGKVLTVGSDGSWEAAPVPKTRNLHNHYLSSLEDPPSGEGFLMSEI